MDVLPSKAIERFLDALWLAVGIGLAAGRLTVRKTSSANVASPNRRAIYAV
jgi:hypothetical protein